VLDLAVAVELVHNATLLHDDVIDLADTRRGAKAARAELGNAASIFAGDWLLIEALRRVRRAGVGETLDRLLATIDEMIAAESTQLENRGRVDVDRELYFRIVSGKSATLFRWAMFAGAAAGGLGADECLMLEHYGLELGVAFQMIDDLLDLTGDSRTTGKSLFSDLREGKMTYPLIVALERDPELRAVLCEIISSDAAPLRAELERKVSMSLQASGAVEECRRVARERALRAVECLAPLPQSWATALLVGVAESTVERRR
jgi:octaprenyl-diphosphate synthase